MLTIISCSGGYDSTLRESAQSEVPSVTVDEPPLGALILSLVSRERER